MTVNYISGPTGCGKSLYLLKLKRDLEARNDLVVLTHAAAAVQDYVGARSSTPDTKRTTLLIDEYLPTEMTQAQRQQFELLLLMDYRDIFVAIEGPQNHWESPARRVKIQSRLDTATIEGHELSRLIRDYIEEQTGREVHGEISFVADSTFGKTTAAHVTLEPMK